MRRPSRRDLGLGTTRPAPRRSLTGSLVGSLGLVAYTFVGYPALMALRARLAPQTPPRAAASMPQVSLIILAFNEAGVIQEKLDNTRSLDYPGDRLEVIVVADGSDDETADLARGDGVRVLHQPERRGKLAAMVRGASAARGTILVFSDANNLYNAEAITAIVAPFGDPSVGVATGRKVIDDGTGRSLDRAEGLYWRYESRLKSWESATGSVTGVAGEIIAFRPESFPELEPGTMNEDFVQAMTAAASGWRVAYAPDAVSIERASATIDDELVRRSRLVTGRWQALVKLLPRVAKRDPDLAFRIVSHKGLRPLVPFAMATALLSNLLLLRGGASRAPQWALPLAAAQLLFYVAASGGWALERRGRRVRALYLPYYFCRANAATVRGCIDFARGRHEAVWAKVTRG